jgi:hypothetical protein
MIPFSLLATFMTVAFGIGMGCAFTFALIHAGRKPTWTLLHLSMWIVALFVFFSLNKSQIDFTK